MRSEHHKKAFRHAMRAMMGGQSEEQERGSEGRGRFGPRMGGQHGGGRHAGGFGHGFGGGFGRGWGRDDGGEGFGGGFGGGRAGGSGGPGGRRGKRFDSEQLRLMVLGLLETAPQHGYQLIRAFAEKSADAYQPSPGVLYPMLTMLAEMDLLAEVAEQGPSSRRSYALTPAGQAEVESRRAEIEGLFARLADMAKAAGRFDPSPLRRAFGGLKMAVGARLERADASNATVLEIARIMDEAAQKIEGL